MLDNAGQMDPRWLGEPPHDITMAMYSWFHTGLPETTYRWLRVGTFSLSHESNLTTRPEFCAARVKAAVKLCGGHVVLAIRDEPYRIGLTVRRVCHSKA